MKLIKYVFNGILVAVAVLLVLVFIGVKVGFFNPKEFPRPYVVYSGSMEPAIKTGSVILSLPSKTYSQGDIVTYSTSGKTGDLVTHRIEFKLYPGGVDSEPLFLTSGDANKTFDQARIKEEDIVGKVVLSLPYLGYLVDFAKKPQGFILFVIVPVTIIIYEELRFLKAQFLARFKGPSPNASRTIKTEREANGLSKSSVFIPLVGAALVLAGVSASFFSDVETSSGNIFTAAESFCTQVGSNIVINEVFYDVNTGHNGQGSENKWEWVELYNPTNTPVDVSSWIIEDGNGSDTFPASIPTIPPCSFAIISNATESELEDQTNNGGRWTIPNDTIFITLSGFIGNGLANGGDIVILKNAGSVEKDRMSWGTDKTGFISGCTPTACPSVASGHSLERVPDGFDTGAAGDFHDTNPPTPGS